jgi:hypothetical protein
MRAGDRQATRSFVEALFHLPTAAAN